MPVLSKTILPGHWGRGGYSVCVYMSDMLTSGCQMEAIQFLSSSWIAVIVMGACHVSQALIAHLRARRWHGRCSHVEARELSGRAVCVCAGATCASTSVGCLHAALGWMNMHLPAALHEEQH